MDANSYLYLLKAIDFHDITRQRKTLTECLRSIKNKIILLGISSDILYPTKKMYEYSQLIPNSVYFEIKSDAGHDAVLTEQRQITKLLMDFL